MNEAMHMATGTKRVVLGHRPTGGGAADRGMEEKADAEEDEATGKARDVMMTEAEIATTTATETDAGALATNDQSDPAQLRKVVRVDHCGTGDVSRTKSGPIVLATATERKRR